MPKSEKMNQKRKKKVSFEEQLLRVKGRSKPSKWVVEVSHWKAALSNEISCEIAFTQYDDKFCLGTTSIDCDDLIEVRRIFRAFEKALEKAEQKYAQLMNR